MGKLHELLAVEADRKAAAEAMIEEALVTFTKRAEHFTGLEKKYRPDDENEGQLDQADEKRALVESVRGKLDYLAESQTAFMDVVCQKEAANTQAKADLVLEDGEVLLTGVPATVLLGLESRLKRLRDVYTVIPTLPPGEDWKRDEKTGFYTAIEKKTRTKKVMKNHVLAPATDKHQANVQVYTEDVRTGIVTTVKESALLSPGEKSEILSRLDRLARAVKQARQRANNSDVPSVQIGKKLFAYINRGDV